MPLNSPPDMVFYGIIHKICLHICKPFTDLSYFGNAQYFACGCKSKNVFILIEFILLKKKKKEKNIIPGKLSGM